MLLSMTGYGDAKIDSNGLCCAVEIRSVNNRFLKTSIRLPERFASFEADVERLIRDRIRRGTINVILRFGGQAAAGVQRINRPLLERYVQDLRSMNLFDPSALGALLALPGVIEDSVEGAAPEEVWPTVSTAVEAALERLDAMRRREGESMSRDLLEAVASIGQLAAQIERLAPEVVSGYRDRLTDRVNALLETRGVTVSPADLLREVSIFAERCDVGEEIVRLKSHLEQFRDTLTGKESNGRKLDFLVQEMNREANTVGSKANDARIARLVVDLKGIIERVRELIQNIE